MPGTPTIVTSCVDGSRAHALERVDSSRSRSRSRPTSGVAGALSSTPTRASASATSHTGTGSALPFACDRLVLAVLDHVPRRAVGRFADEDPVRRRGRLQPRGRVDDVARDHPLARSSGRASTLTSASPGVHGDPHLELAVVGDARRGSPAPRAPPARGRPRARPARRTPPSPRRRRTSRRCRRGARAPSAAVRGTGRRIASTSSGSSDSARAVKPTRSAKSTVTTFRSRAHQRTRSVGIARAPHERRDRLVAVRDVARSRPSARPPSPRPRCACPRDGARPTTTFTRFSAQSCSSLISSPGRSGMRVRTTR